MIKHTGYYLLPLMLLVPKVTIGIEWNAQNLPLTTILAAGVVQSDANGDLFTSTTINASGLNLETLAVSGTSNLNGTVTTGGTVNVAGPLNVTGAETVGGTLTTLGVVNVAGPLSVTGAENVGGTLTALGVVNVEGPLSVTGAVNVGGALGVSGAANIDGVVTTLGAVNIEGPLSVTGAEHVGGALGVSGAATFDNKATFASGARLPIGVPHTKDNPSISWGPNTGFYSLDNGLVHVAASGSYVAEFGPTDFHTETGVTLLAKGPLQADGVANFGTGLNVTGATNLRGQVKMSGRVDLGSVSVIDMGAYPNVSLFTVVPPSSTGVFILGDAPAGRIAYILNATGAPVTFDTAAPGSITIPSYGVGAVIAIDGWKIIE